MANYGDLRVWWIPQMPGRPFHVSVKDLEQAGLVLDLLAEYDEFQFKQGVKPDYSNAGGLEVYEKASIPLSGDRYWLDGWVDWYSGDGDDFDD